MSNNLKFSIVFEAVTAQFNGAIQTISTNFDAAASNIQGKAVLMGQATAQANQQISKSGDGAAKSINDVAKAADGASASGGNLARQMQGTNAELQRTDNITRNLGASWGQLSGVLASIGVGVSVKEIIALADGYQNLQAVIKLAAGEGQAFVAAFAGVKQVANDTFSSLQTTADLFRKVTAATKELGVAQSQALDITRTVNQAVQLSGATAAGAEGAILQFSQALASGRLSGEEFNSVSEQAPRLLQILKDELQLTTGELRALAGEQKLTTDILIRALKNQADTVDQEFSKLPLTVGRATQLLKNSWQEYIGEVDQANGVTKTIADAVVALANNLDTLGQLLKTAVTVAIAFKAVDLATAMFAKANAATAAANALRLESTAIVSNTVAMTTNATAIAATAAATNSLATARYNETLAAAKQGNMTAQISLQQQAAAMKVAEANRQAAADAAAATKNIGGMTQSIQAAGQSAVALGARLVGALSIAGLVYLAVSLLKQFGDGIAALAAKVTGLEKELKDSEKAIADQDKKLKDLQEQHKKTAETTKMLSDAQAGLSKESSKLTAKFDETIKSGKGVKAALDDMAGAFRFDDLSGINNAISALNALQQQGKASGEQVRKALQDGLSGADLVAFETNARASFGALIVQLSKDADKLNAELVKKQKELASQLEQSRSAATAEARTAALQAATALESQISDTQAKIRSLRGQVEQEAAKIALVHDAVVNEAVRRTGIAYSILSGEVGAASRSAINDIDLIAQNLGKLREEGVNTGLALGASLLKGIQDSDSQQALDIVKSRVIALRGELDQKVVDGLLNEASRQALKLKDDLDDATAGINSVREAFREFGLKTREEYQAVADRQKAAFDEMRSSGQATTSQLQEAFQKYAENAIAANRGVADGFVLAQASVLGFEVATDDAGNSVVRKMAEAKAATDRLTGASYGAAGGYQNLGNAAEIAGNQAVQSIEEQIAATQRLRQEQAKARDAELSAQRGAPVNSADNLGGVGIAAYSRQNIMQRLVSELGFDQSKAMVEAQRIFQAYIDTERTKAPWQASLSNAGFVDAELLRLAQYSSGRMGGSALNGVGDGVAKTTNVNLTLGGKTVNTNIPADQEQDFLTMLGQARNVSGG